MVLGAYCRRSGVAGMEGEGIGVVCGLVDLLKSSCGRLLSKDGTIMQHKHEPMEHVERHKAIWHDIPISSPCV